MARTANINQPEVETPPLKEQELTYALNTITAIQSEYNEDRDLVNQLLGQVQMADSFSQFSKTVYVSKLSYVKENQLYKNLKGKKNVNGLPFSGTWEEFCKLLGMSRVKVDEDIANLKNLGEEALESMSRMGIGYRELRQYRKLPDDQKEALIEVAKAGDKETLVELAEEFIAKSTKEKQTLERENADLKADYSALSKRSADIAAEKEKLALKLTQFEMNTIPLDDRLEPFKIKIAETQSRIDELLEQQRQYVQHMDMLQKEIMQNDPTYDPESPYTFPPAMLVTLLILHESLKLTTTQAKNTYQELWMNFSDEIDPEIANSVIGDETA